MISVPKVAPCPEKARLFEELSAAMEGILALNNRELEAAVACKLALLESIRADLQQARERKDAGDRCLQVHDSFSRALSRARPMSNAAPEMASASRVLLNSRKGMPST